MLEAQRIVYVVDDDPAVRRSLERLLDAADFRAVSFGYPEEFLDAVKSPPPGCCALVDLRLPGMSGLKVLELLRRIDARLPVIVMTGHGDVQSAVQAMKTGAADFIEKPYSDDALITAIDTAVTTGARQGSADEAAEAASLIGTLSPREKQVLYALMAGRANKAIAFELGISVRTVEVHRARMMERLDVRQLGQAVRLAVLAQLDKG